CGHDSIRLWETNAFRKIAELRGHTAKINSVQFSPDTSVLASGSDDRTIAIWQSSRARQVRLLRGHTDSVTCIAFSPSQGLLASGSAGHDGTVRLWDWQKGVQLRAFQTRDRVNAIAFSPDGRLVAAGNRFLTVWDVLSGEPILDRATHWIRSLSFR